MKLVIQTPKTIKELEDHVESLVKQFGHSKCNIRGEGAWVTFANKESADRARDDKSNGEEVEVVVCNDLLSLPASWGLHIIAVTKGSQRPTATLEKQPDEVKESHKNLIKLITK